MSIFFILLFLAAVILSIKPKWLFKSGKVQRKHTIIAAIVVFILMLVTAPDGKKDAEPLAAAAPSSDTTSTTSGSNANSSASPAAAAVAASESTVAPAANKEASTPNKMPAKIVKVTDGDTMHIELGGKEETIRLLLVDTPETVHPDKPKQPFGPEASEFAKQLLSGKDVAIEIDVSERDKYGRLLCYLWIGDKMFNEMLLEKGLARVAYVIPPNVKYVDHFREIQKAAQQNKLGIWSIENYATEDGFDDSKAKPSTTTTPAVQPQSPAKSTTSDTPTANTAASYKNCTEAKAAGAAPIRRGEPGYSTKLDRDGDGIGCEK